MISNRMMFYSLVFCDDIVQNIWFVTSSLVHILQLNISARFCFRNLFGGQPVDSNNFNLCRESSVDLKFTFSSGVFNKHEIYLMNHQMHY